MISPVLWLDPEVSFWFYWIYLLLFYTTDTYILLKNIHDHLGIFGSAHTWFSSYMSDRTQHMKIGTDTSSECLPKYGVPHGSVLGPLLFTVYTAPMQDILKRHAVEYHTFAVYFQMYTSNYPQLPNVMESATQRLYDCIKEVKCWMVHINSKLNDEKTECMVALSRYPRRKFEPPKNLVVRCATIKYLVSVRNFGAHFDTHMSMWHHKLSACDLQEM